MILGKFQDEAELPPNLAVQKQTMCVGSPSPQVRPSSFLNILLKSSMALSASRHKQDRKYSMYEFFANVRLYRKYTLAFI